MAKSFLKRIDPVRQRWKHVRWPFPVEGESSPDDRPMLKLRVLGFNELEAAHLATLDHFKDRKPPLKTDDEAFLGRERAELIFRAYSDEGGAPIADDVDELAEEPAEILYELHATRAQFQADVAAAPYTSKQMDAFVEHLKKNAGLDLLPVLSSNTLIGLITTLVSPQVASIPANERG